MKCIMKQTYSKNQFCCCKDMTHIESYYIAVLINISKAVSSLFHFMNLISAFDYKVYYSVTLEKWCTTNIYTTADKNVLHKYGKKLAGQQGIYCSDFLLQAYMHTHKNSEMIDQASDCRRCVWVKAVLYFNVRGRKKVNFAFLIKSSLCLPPVCS